MPRGRHRQSPPLHRLLPPATVAGASLACAAGAWFVGDDLVQRVLAAGAAAAALTGAVLLRTWDRTAGRQVAELNRARVRDEWRTEERIAELETDVEESREIRAAWRPNCAPSARSWPGCAANTPICSADTPPPRPSGPAPWRAAGCSPSRPPPPPRPCRPSPVSPWRCTRPPSSRPRTPVPRCAPTRATAPRRAKRRVRGRPPSRPGARPPRPRTARPPPPSRRPTRRCAGWRVTPPGSAPPRRPRSCRRTVPGPPAPDRPPPRRGRSGR